MTETEWLEADAPWKMMYPPILATRITEDEGKDLLWKIACVRRVWHMLSEPFRRLIVMMERQVEGYATQKQVAKAKAALPNGDNAAERVISDPGNWKWWERIEFLASEAVAGCVPGQISPPGHREVFAAERRAQADLLREIFGNPFRPITLNPSWLTPTVVSLAQTIDDQRAFDRMPILADALEEAGCDNADILNHCRQPGEHVRGCWVIDVLLGKQ